ncbi:tyrosine-type recombinase/integrase [Pelistega europaea]|uniref:Tyrosine-type recombinase/integrase n=1 Tax=Pelistega europaea TaxID=106147 RepID=A0A7Y4P6G4_9BURK|nr:tyrosine-type recombinase/integrase [Pelistega europaea]NOL49889.1 tyrosine-type recombinase/integrase [Pelistega europaea]
MNTAVGIQKTNQTKMVMRLLYQNKRYSMAFTSPKEFRAWVVAKTQELDVHQDKKASHNITLRLIFQRYINEKLQAPVKKQDRNRIQKFLRDNVAIVSKPLSDVTKADMRGWIKRRSEEVSGTTIRKEVSHINMVYKIAQNEWDLKVKNPLIGLTKPTAKPPRERLIYDWEIETLKATMGYCQGIALPTIKLRTIVAFLFALETGLRAGEICKLKWEDISVSGKVLKVKNAKTRSGIREVPLSSTARDLLQQCGLNNSSDTVFRLKPSQLDSNFRRYRDKAGLKGFTFHDARATAITRLAKKLNVLDLARIIGHKNVQTLMIYYREGAETLVEKLG